MIGLQSHRGPDGQHFYESEYASLGHCRLAILDLSPAGRQPMCDPTGRYWLVFNGEIYNHLELRSELRRAGFKFRSKSDSEVLLYSFVHWGEECLQRLRGMFAFAVWDARDKTLFAARDRLGIKPFHYWVDGDTTFAFASELKALSPFLPERQINLHLAEDYLAWNLLEHDCSHTFVQGIHRLPPAHSLSWGPARGLKLNRYWKVAINEDLRSDPSLLGALSEEFRQQFEDSIACHLRSDVPVGTSLSGGLDSSAIVCLASQNLKKTGLWYDGWQHTFSACFEEPSLDERVFIEEVATVSGCSTHFVFPTGEQLLDDLRNWLWHQDEPVGGTGTYAHFCVARLAHHHGVKVLLDGQGADEILAGYRKFILSYIMQLFSERQYLEGVREAVSFLSPSILRTARISDGRRYFSGTPSPVEKLWPDGPPTRPQGLALGQSLGKRVEADLTRFSLPVLLRYEDRNTMAFGVEARVPFVDHVFVEWQAALPADLRLSHGWTKRLLRESMKGVLPERVRLRKTKLGFSTPEAKWLDGPLSGWIDQTLTSPVHLDGLIDIPGLREMKTQFRRGNVDKATRSLLFRLATFETWAELFVSNPPPTPDGSTF